MDAGEFHSYVGDAGPAVRALFFENAFDSAEHDAIWHALEASAVPAEYVQALKKLYDGQEGEVKNNRQCNCRLATRHEIYA